MTNKHKKFVKLIEDSLETKPQEMVSITDALGRIIADDVMAQSSAPAEDTAAIDGYAIIAENVQTLPTSLTKIGESNAARTFKGQIYDGDAVKVYSGATIPRGGNTVIPMEYVKEKADEIVVTKEVMSEQNICYAGIDFTEKEPVLLKGEVVTARDIGLAAAMKVPWLPVVRRPRVGVLSIGDELAMMGTSHDNTRVTASSGLVISAFVSACGAVPVNLGIATDSLSSIKHVLESAEGMDLVVTTGGVSAAADNLLRNLLKQHNNTLNEVNVNLNQMEHILYTKRKGIPIMALPGNPISTQICAALFLRPAIEKMLNLKAKIYKKNYAILDRDLDVNDLKMDYIFSKLTEGTDKHLLALPASSYDRLLLSALAEADCLIAVDKDNHTNGSEVEITRFALSVISG